MQHLDSLLAHIPRLPEESPTRYKTRVKILHTAYLCIAEQSLAMTTMVELQKRSGLARRTLYNYVQSVEEICSQLHPAVLHGWLKEAGVLKGKLPYDAILSALHQQLMSNQTLMNYLVKMDYSLQREPGLIEPGFQLSAFLQQHLPFKDPHRATGHAHRLVESFLAYVERVSFRQKVYQSESHLADDSFLMFIKAIQPLLPEEQT